MSVDILANIDVDDLPKAVDFYCSALGLHVGRRFGDAAVELLGGSSAVYLLKKAAGTKATPTSSDRRAYGRHWTPVHLDFVVPAIAPAVKRAQDAGAHLEGEVHDYNWGRLAAFGDPFGHGFCLIEFIGRGYDEIAS